MLGGHQESIASYLGSLAAIQDAAKSGLGHMPAFELAVAFPIVPPNEAL